VSDKPIIRHWWLIRHAPVLSSVLYGQLDIEASLPADSVFEDLAGSLPKISQVFSSDLTRCVATANRIIDFMGVDPLPVQEMPEFREQDFGAWQGLSYSEIENQYPSAYRAFWENAATVAPPKGESFERMAKRVCEARQKLQSRCTEENILLVAHAGTIRALVGEALGLQPEKALSLVVDPLSLTRLTSYVSPDCQENWAVNCLNRPFVA